MKEETAKKGFKDYLRDPNMWLVLIIVSFSALIGALLEPILFPGHNNLLQEIIIQVGIMTPIVLVISLIARAIKKNKK